MPESDPIPRRDQPDDRRDISYDSQVPAGLSCNESEGRLKTIRQCTCVVREFGEDICRNVIKSIELVDEHLLPDPVLECIHCDNGP